MAKSEKTSEDKAYYPPVTPFAAGVKATCPRCGQGRLYSGLLQPARGCLNCKLDYSFIDSGDGPAVFVIMILGFVILGLALAVESAFHLPIWLHMVIWLPVIIGTSLWALRVGKAFMIALQYQTNARQGVLTQEKQED